MLRLNKLKSIRLLRQLDGDVVKRLVVSATVTIRGEKSVSATQRGLASLPSQPLDVIVVGCGASGIAALRRLHEAGLKVLGLEAADKIGGRIQTVQFGDNVVDIGAAWCHGEKDNIVFELADPLCLLGRPAALKQWYMLSSGHVLNGDDIIKALENALASAKKTGDCSILKCVQDAAKWIPLLQCYPELCQGFIEWFSRSKHLGGQRDPSEGKSLRGLEEAWPCDGEVLLHWKGRGYKSILDVLLKSYPVASQMIPVSILTNKEVEEIRWKSPDEGKTAGLLQVTCRGYHMYKARSVIVTVSVGVLKENYVKLFNPPLPKEKVTALKNLQMCVLDKIYIEFSHPWWCDPSSSINIIWREQDKNCFTPEERWVTEIYGFQTVDCQPNVLLTWIYGEGAKEMEKVSEECVKKGIEKLLNFVFGEQCDLAPITNILRTKWATNRLARGAYAYRSVATEQQGGLGAKTLSEPLIDHNRPVVCFAGEATSLHRHGSVHGAIEAGFREADRLIDSLRKQ